MIRTRTLVVGLAVSFVAALLLLPPSAANAAQPSDLAPTASVAAKPNPIQNADQSGRKARRYWGAISISSDHTFTYAIDYRTKRGAINAAYNRCKNRSDYPRYCRKATWFSNYCAAIVYRNYASGFIKKYRIGYGRTRPIAIRAAHRHMAGKERLLGWACTTRYR